ncbi:MAG: hypothetical protein ACKVQB_04200 [Bacteroidia bacterium]
MLKYKFNTDEIYFIRVLFFAVAFAMPFVVANAFSFANFDKMDLKYYLKSKPKHQVIIENAASVILKNTIENLGQKPFWTLKSQNENSAVFKVKNLILTDEVNFKTETMAENKTQLTITSKPLQSYIFLDFGRNYRNILNVLLATKST